MYVKNMLLTPNSFFPGLSFVEVNINNRLKEINSGFSTQEMQNNIVKLGLTYGGYSEDRSWMWQNTYLKNKDAIHLGVDINVPCGTNVNIPFISEVIDVYNDADTDIGWGTRLIVKRGSYAIILAHLQKIPHLAGDMLMPGFKATVGTYPDNGNVFEHLHVQVMHIDNLNIEKLDGYGTYEDLKTNLNPFAIDL